MESKKKEGKRGLGDRRVWRCRSSGARDGSVDGDLARLEVFKAVSENGRQETGVRAQAGKESESRFGK